MGRARNRFGDDDRGIAYAVVDPREGALVAVSLAPDWELRHLLPLLERATGLPTRGFVRAGERTSKSTNVLGAIAKLKKMRS